MMQWRALGVGVIALLLTGCAATPKSSRSHLPAPLLSTGKQTPLPPAPPPPRREPRVTRRPVRKAPGVRLDPRELIPPGGIKRGLWKTIVVHHSASPRSTPQGMHEYHLNKGWSRGLGYHFVIGNGSAYPDGKVFVGPRWKRQISGAHCRSSAGRYFGTWRQRNFFNTQGIGICLIGNFENSSPTPRQLEALAQLVQFLCNETGIDPSHVYGHGEVTHRTACPGRRLNMALVRRRANQIYAGTYR
jgi:hypothetical protein